MLTLGLDNKPKLSQETFGKLKDIIYARCGIAFTETKKYFLESRLAKRLDEKNLKSFEDYYYYITYDPDREKELVNLVNTIVTNETSFFRDPAQLEGFRRGVVPKVIEEKQKASNKRIRVWSSASSTGEEPYTLAMMLMEEGLHLAGYTIEVIGSDICDSVLRSAAAATYDKYSLRNTPEPYLKKYFIVMGDAYTVKKSVQDVVKFHKVNLMEPFHTRLIRDVDVIFCRNVLIYFDDAAKKKVISNLYDSLAKGGYLIVGFSESLHNITRVFRPVNIERSLVYQKA
ncbi:MAG: protein-glutamate O-methyltransferase CheR [Deltaproteobacteria bacterium]|nr:protein-glutamate O-methyltransferase CheR [Deltaproteobacteria bacterium]MBI5809998.1 protein-glutamate O-methyltransferase CheR [Deltaproteobacteria bacterium]